MPEELIIQQCRIAGKLALSVQKASIYSLMMCHKTMSLFFSQPFSQDKYQVGDITLTFLSYCYFEIKIRVPLENISEH